MASLRTAMMAAGVYLQHDAVIQALGDDSDFATTVATALAGKQPLDPDLTAIAALTTTAYGRAFLALVDAAAARTALALGTAATANTGDFDGAGAAAAAQTAATNAAAADATTKANAAQAAAIAASQPVHLVSRLTSATTRTLTTYAGTGLSVSVASGKAYRIQAVGQYRTAALTTGIGFRLGGTATAAGVRYRTLIDGLSLTSYTSQAQSALGVTAAFSTAVAVANTDYPWSIDGLIRVAAAGAGTVTVDFATEVASSTATVQPDSFLLLEEVA